MNVLVRPAAVTAAAGLLVAGLAAPANADNCSGLSDCFSGNLLPALLLLLGLLLVIAAGWYLAPLLARFAIGAALRALLTAAARARAPAAIARAIAAARQARLLAALRAAGAKFTPEAIVGITRTVTGRIVWLETGTAAAGLGHIMQRHGSQFAAWGLRTGPQVGQFIMNTLRTATPIATHPGGAMDFAVRVNGVDRVVRIVIGGNGFVVTAHPL